MIQENQVEKLILPIIATLNAISVCNKAKKASQDIKEIECQVQNLYDETIRIRDCITNTEAEFKQLMADAEKLDAIQTQHTTRGI